MMARQRENVDENVDENFELFKQVADLTFETEGVKDRYAIQRFLEDPTEPDASH